MAHRIAIEPPMHHPLSDDLVLSVHNLFALQASLTPDAVAVEAKGAYLTYSELDRRANALAHKLIEAGIRRGECVAVKMERSHAMVVALLAILKAGAAYVPIDPQAPAKRCSFVLRESQSRALLTDVNPRSRDEYPDTDVDLPVSIGLAEDSEIWNVFPNYAPDVETSARDLMYVLYTSGTTGNPKGVMIEHAGVSQLLLWMIAHFGFGRADRVLQKTPYTFDASVWELFVPLLSGGTVVLAEHEAYRDPAYLAATIASERITVAQFVPSMLRHVLDQPDWKACVSLRHLFCGGEALTGDLVDHVHAQHQIPVHNLYGPTETSVQVMTWTCRPGEHYTHVPIGRPIPGVLARTLDSSGRPTPTGEAGELYISGAALARGYLGQPELTAQKFCGWQGHFAPYDRLYRTGDLVREDANGCFHYLGRLDDQVKIHGNRVELGEIEVCLNTTPGIAKAAVVVEGAVEQRPARLIAFLVPMVNSTIRLSELRAHLSTRLPDYMIPAEFRLVDHFPLTAHGKLDKASLQAQPSKPLVRQGKIVAAQTDIERSLSELWRTVLGVESVGIDQDFFELGGDSMTGLIMIAQARSQQINLTPKDLFRLRRIDAISQHLASKSGTSAPSTRTLGL